VVKNNGKDLMTYFEKNVALSLIDDAWKDHLRLMDDLKQEVQTAGYEQKDPLVIYKIESFNLFKSLISHINKENSRRSFSRG
jgi:preprotein translocase subunit SecA